MADTATEIAVHELHAALACLRHAKDSDILENLTDLHDARRILTELCTIGECYGFVRETQHRAPVSEFA